jgi:mRNA-degrading endonuclease HigB of HigAB toxin-antitoxin module
LLTGSENANNPISIKLTDVTRKVGKLTHETTRPFVVCFHEKLFDDYNFEKLQQETAKEFQRFLDKVAKKTFQEVEAYKAETDRNDKYGEFQVIHYTHGKKFRIHGFIDENGEFCVIRIDPNHKFHK